MKQTIQIVLAVVDHASGHDLGLSHAIIAGTRVLLTWLETQLGLRTHGAHRLNRITEFTNLLEKSSVAKKKTQTDFGG